MLYSILQRLQYTYYNIQYYMDCNIYCNPLDTQNLIKSESTHNDVLEDIYVNKLLLYSVLSMF